MTGKKLSRSPQFRPVSTVDAAAAALRNAIATRQLMPGDRIKEIPVAAELGLSRGPVREALRLLAEEGLVQLTLNVGATISVVHALDLMELYALRLSLGALALRNLSDAHDLTDATDQLHQLSAAVKHKDIVAAVEADLGLQDALVRASGLSRTVLLFERTTIQLRVYAGMLGVDYKPLLPAMLKEDSKLLELVVSGEPEAFLPVWRTKIEGWLKTFVTQLAETYDHHLWRTAYVGDPKKPE